MATKDTQYRFQKDHGDWKAGDEKTAKDIGDQVDQLLTDGVILQVADDADKTNAAAKSSTAKSSTAKAAATEEKQPEHTVVAGKNGTITATFK